MRRLLALLLPLCFVAACATTAKSFNQELLIGLNTIGEVKNQAALLVRAGKLSVKGAEDVQRQTDELEALFSAARVAYPKDPKQAYQNLDFAKQSLTALQAYLLSKEKP